MYKICKILGQGGFGQIYIVSRYDNKSKYYAMKKISIYRSNNYKKSIINEIRILKYCVCPYIIKYIDCQYNGSNIDIIIQFIKKGDLQKIITKRKRKFDEPIIWSYIIQLCLGVQYLHKNNIIHRDIKSSNILIDHIDNLYITDFGASKVFLTCNSLTNTLVGTPLYCSPEIISKQEYSYKIDVWGIGCVLFECITFSPPFLARNIQSLNNKILQVDFSKNLSLYTEKYSKNLIQLVGQILVKDENKRLSIHNLLNMPCIQEHLYLIPYTTKKSINISQFNEKFCNLEHKRWFDIINLLKSNAY